MTTAHSIIKKPMINSAASLLETLESSSRDGAGMYSSLYRDTRLLPEIVVRKNFMSTLRNDRFLVGLEVLERFAGAFGDAVRRVFGEACFDARAAEDELGKIAQL